MTPSVRRDELGNIQSSLDYFLKYNLSTQSKILDVGCNYGSLIFNLDKLGYHEVCGVDVNPEAVRVGREYYKEISDRISVQESGRLDFQNEQFDSVLMFDVIEHVPDVATFLKNEVFRVLKKDGIFIFQTPNKFINIPWEIINQRSFTAWRKYHCSLQTYGSLKTLLEQSGFRSILIEKNDILTQHNRDKVKKKLGNLGVVLLHFLQILPMIAYPNFWGCGKK